ncbi:MAG: GNAT family N-acetyltransferase [Jiangellaceae bacterium]|nr:GNAT family N-acetyltransferase [Jiangellaceae bacterium]
MVIRDAVSGDWPPMWRFMRQIAAAADTFCWDPQISEDDARALWMHNPPARTFVAVDTDGAVVGTAEVHPNQGGPGSHVANAGFMVDPARPGRGIGRALGEHVLAAAQADGYRAMQFNAVVETNLAAVALWRSLGFEVLATVPEAFRHPSRGYVGLHLMYRRL